MWKPVVGFESAYDVSDDGLVRRKICKGSRTQRILKPAADHHGYGRVKLSLNGIVSTHSVHKLVAQAFIRTMNPEDTINHKNCDKNDNRASNLEYCTRLENTAHAVTNGRISLSNAVLTLDAIADIRANYVAGTKSSEILAKKYGVTRRTICRLIAGTNWGHVTLPTA